MEGGKDTLLGKMLVLADYDRGVQGVIGRHFTALVNRDMNGEEG